MPKDNRPVKIDIKKADAKRLLDDKVLKNRGFGFVQKLLIFLAALAVVAAGAMIGYTLFSGKSEEGQKTPSARIIVPENSSAPEETDTSAPAETPVVIRQVTIQATPTGFLNVRSGPGTNFEKIAQVKPGETYDFVSENMEETWFEIRLSETQTGWVIKDFAKEK